MLENVGLGVPWTPDSMTHGSVTELCSHAGMLHSRHSMRDACKYQAFLL